MGKRISCLWVRNISGHEEEEQKVQNGKTCYVRRTSKEVAIKTWMLYLFATRLNFSQGGTRGAINGFHISKFFGFVDIDTSLASLVWASRAKKSGRKNVLGPVKWARDFKGKMFPLSCLR